MATVEELLRAGVERLRASGSETPRLDAELLLGHAVGLDRTGLIAQSGAPVGADAAAAYEAFLARREAGEPVAYIRGFKEFFGLALSVDRRALIPRPETERLVELAEAEVVRRLAGAPRPPGTPALAVVDVGTGSGAIAVALAVALRRRRVGDEVRLLAVDASPGAVDLARENAVGHAVADRIEFAVADLVPRDAGPFDLVLANLPYVRADAVDSLPVAASFEPRAALDGGPDGTAVIRRLLELLPAVLAPGGAALLEIGADQADLVTAAIEAALPGARHRVEPDLAGLPRVALVELPERAPR